MNDDKPAQVNGLPKYHGNRAESLEEWIFQVDEGLRTNNVQGRRVMGIIIPLLKDNALQEYRKLHNNFVVGDWDLDNLSWNVLKDRFRRVFNNDDDQRKLRNELRELTGSPNEDYNEYLKRFLIISSRIEGLPEAELLHSFIAGLGNRIKGEV
jgi:hypothetical protein